MELNNLIKQIRTLVNEPHNCQIFLQQGISHQVCSSMDTIGDTESALESYLKYSIPSEHGIQYLCYYGSLQCLFVQQDATRHLLEVLSKKHCRDFVKDEEFKILKQIRIFRNCSIGHPTKSNENQSPSYHYINRHSSNKNSFDLLTFNGTKQKKDSIDIPALILQQHDILFNILNRLIDKLK